MALPYDDIHLIADPIYGYLRITMARDDGEVAEADIIDDPWVQRLKRIHQLQSSWWVFPTAEHSRFAHSLGVMHLAGELAKQVYPTLSAVEADTPSLPLVEETLRLAGLLHDLGHGPFSHFFDEEYLQPCFSINHEIISQHLITQTLGGAIAALERSPSGAFAPRERVDPVHVAALIRADADGDDDDGLGGAEKGGAAGAAGLPRGVALQQRALAGAVTVDNMDYVRRDAYMCGVSLNAVDVDRLLYYTFCTAEGLTFHKRALSSLRAFLNARFYLYENVYFHRIGHAIDMHLHEIFRETLGLILPESPLDDLEAYRRLTEWSLFNTVETWLDEPAGSQRRRLGEEWQAIIHRDVKYHMVYEQSVERQQPAPASRDLTVDDFHAAIVANLPARLRAIEFKVDIASQDPRPLNPMRGPKRIPVYDPSTGAIEEQLLSGILEFVPAKAHLYRVFTTSREYKRELADAARKALSADGQPTASDTNL
jgi:HD superfamily phosphohydrolase